ncbi:RalBP1-associated Eps domain-containing protein 1 [Homalodisca vitripennis]|nr:RalBP1-associated Eps domain-containing protein 1 [Homalodisca vitripennis]
MVIVLERVKFHLVNKTHVVELLSEICIVQDPKILHPVPLRVTPGPDVLDDEPKKLTEQLSGGDASPIRPIQRPQPKKPAAPGPGAIPPPPQAVLDDIVG